VKALRQVVLTESRLLVELHDDGGLCYLDVRSLIDREQMFLLPLTPGPGIDGLAMHTNLGRLHALYWGLAWGAGTLPVGASVRFSSDALRFRGTAEVTPRQLGSEAWVADAEGTFTSATTVVSGIDTARTQLAERW
jgi:hypothetical protein